MVCLGNICINTLQKGAEDDDDDDDDDNNQSVYAVSGTSRYLFSYKHKHINTVWAERTVVEC
jgi:hypothetical protein